MRLTRRVQAPIAGVLGCQNTPDALETSSLSGPQQQHIRSHPLTLCPSAC